MASFKRERMMVCIATVLSILLGMQSQLFVNAHGPFIQDCLSHVTNGTRLHHKGFCKAYTCYYSNSTATFNVELLRCGDVASNPGPRGSHHPQVSGTSPGNVHYNRHELLEVRSSTDINRNFPITEHVLGCIRELGIDAYAIPQYKKTHRGVRAGARKQRQIPNRITFDRPTLGYCRTVGTCHANLRYLPCNDESKLNFCSINTQSIRNKSIDFTELVLQHNLDIVAVSETWLRPYDSAVIAELTPMGYSFLHVP